ncbi:hypothetical protein Cni_G00475 [Canna indica]|uniref:Zinc finger PMZ-type domain-containing protein n=1 Tax=Canna indica TaxID=4628 RepID=A0AAQ3JMV4_9LILI|nr:hypothetical protein Cni_G00475 [Canna indica]
MPQVEHRNCARHIYANWKKTYNGYGLKNIFWRAVKSTTEADFIGALDEMRAMSPEAVEAFTQIEVQNFYRLCINVLPACEVVDNNQSECFNVYILKARTKPLIDMLEEIRTSVMQRIVLKREKILSWTNELCPRIKKILEQNKLDSRGSTLTPNGQNRMWQLCGIPCPHAIAAINYLGRDPAHFVDSYLKKKTYMLAYQSTIEPMSGQNMWPRMNELLLPPIFLKKAGKPKKVRKKDKSEKDPNPKKYDTIKYSICGI